MNALLVSPRFPETFWSFSHALKMLRRKAAFPPLGLLTVAALLPQEWPKRLVDTNVRKLRDKDLAWADCVFISAMTVQQRSSREIIARCKEAGVKVVAGGPLFTNEPEQFSDVDHLVLNEAELTLPGFLADLEAGSPKRVYTTAEFPDIRTTPAPLWDLVKLNAYGSMNIQYSRGCPFNCDFCNVTSLFGHRVRTKTTEQVITELDALHQRGWHGSVFFVDDNFIGNKHRLKTDLLPALIRWRRDKQRIVFYTESSIDLADDEELMALMVEAGFDSVFVGIETPNESALAECNKKQNTGRNLMEDVKRIQRAGLQVQGGFIVGFDTDTPAIFHHQIEFIQKSGIVAAMVGILQAVPGTLLFERLQREGRLKGSSTGDNGDGTTNIVSRMNADVLLDGYRRILAHIYSPRHYYQRVKTFLREYQPPKIQAKPDLTRIMAFIRSMWRLGILGRERFHYWKLILWTGFCRRKAFSQAVTLAIYGYHFRRFCKSHVLTPPPTP